MTRQRIIFSEWKYHLARIGYMYAAWETCQTSFVISEEESAVLDLRLTADD